MNAYILQQRTSAIISFLLSREGLIGAEGLDLMIFREIGPSRVEIFCRNAWIPIGKGIHDSAVVLKCIITVFLYHYSF